MQSNSKRRKSAECDRYQQKIMELPCPVTGLTDDLHLHHPKGAQYQLKDNSATRWVGEHYIYPLYYQLHDPSFHLHAARAGYKNRHYNKYEFEHAHGYDIEHFQYTINNYVLRFGQNDEDINWKIINLILKREARLGINIYKSKGI